MTPDEVRRMENKNALLFIRGERPIKDQKYDVLRHPNIALTTDGGAAPYTYGEDTRSVASLAFVFDSKTVKKADAIDVEQQDFLLLSEEELEERINKLRSKNDENEELQNERSENPEQ